MTRKKTDRPSKPHRKYTDEQIAGALAALTANAGNVLRTSRELGVHQSTIRQWAGRSVKLGKQVPQAIKETASTRIANELEDMIGLALAKLRHGLTVVDPAKSHDVQAIATSMAIMTDKMRLLRSEPTNITADLDLASFLRQSGYDRVRIVAPTVALPVLEGSVVESDKAS